MIVFVFPILLVFVLLPLLAMAVVVSAALRPAPRRVERRPDH